MTDNILPEEKLLRLIRGDKKPSQNLSSLEKRTHSLKQKSFNIKYMNFPFLSFNRLTFILFIFSLIYLTASFVYPLIFLKTIRLPKVTQNIKDDLIQKSKIIAQKPLDSYLQEISSKEIFSNYSAQESETPTGVVSADLIKDINLVGIVSGPDSQAVVEDKKAQKTYYLRKGQAVGDFRLEEILEGKIILSYNGERFELYL